jgi:hypothetical protein
MATGGNENLLFIHIPKTGGNWVWEAMKAGGVELEVEGHLLHPTLRELDRRGRFTFGFVREPSSWYASVWRFRRKLIEEENHMPGEFPDEWVLLDFPDFVATVERERPSFLSSYFEEFIGPPEARIDFVGRYEALADDLVLALKRAGQEFDEEALRAIPPLNVTKAPPAGLG